MIGPCGTLPLTNKMPRVTISFDHACQSKSTTSTPDTSSYSRTDLPHQNCTDCTVNNFFLPFILIFILSVITISYKNPNPNVVRFSCMHTLHAFLLCMQLSSHVLLFLPVVLLQNWPYLPKIDLFSKLGLHPTGPQH
jgi:hypothetical protein